jgi:hypothetical protein
MSPDGSETKFKKEMAKHPVTLMIRIASGVHTGIEDTHSAIVTKATNPSAQRHQKIPFHPNDMIECICNFKL